MFYKQDVLYLMLLYPSCITMPDTSSQKEERDIRHVWTLTCKHFQDRFSPHLAKLSFLSSLWQQPSIASGFGDVPGSAVEDQSDSDTDQGMCKAQLLLLNRQYQLYVVDNLQRVREALEKNRNLQVKILKVIKQTRVLRVLTHTKCNKISWSHCPDITWT